MVENFNIDRLYEIDKSWKNNLMIYGVPCNENMEEDSIITEEKVRKFFSVIFAFITSASSSKVICVRDVKKLRAISYRHFLSIFIKYRLTAFDKSI